jgi:hypothetical protein
MTGDLNKKCWGWVQSKLPIGYCLDIAFNDFSRHYTFYDCMSFAIRYAARQSFYLAKIDGATIIEIYTYDEAVRIKKLEQL